MERFTKNLSSKEKMLLVIFSLAILVMLYYLFVDRPVRTAMETAVTQGEDLKMQIDVLTTRAAEIKSMQNELKTLRKEKIVVSEMPSYNASKQEVDFLNSTLSQAQDYYIGFSQVTREGDLIRRNFALQYRTANYQAAVDIMRNLEHSWIRCLISDMTVTSAEDDGNIKNGAVQVSCSATFYETMYDGKEDPELPEDTAANAIEDQMSDLDEVMAQ